MMEWAFSNFSVQKNISNMYSRLCNLLFYVLLKYINSSGISTWAKAYLTSFQNTGCLSEHVDKLKWKYLKVKKRVENGVMSSSST